MLDGEHNLLELAWYARRAAQAIDAGKKIAEHEIYQQDVMDCVSLVMETLDLPSFLLSDEKVAAHLRMPCTCHVPMRGCP